MTSIDYSRWLPVRRFTAIIGLLIIIAVLMPARRAQAWGAEGHRIIGMIAWHYLTPEAKPGTTGLLGEQSWAKPDAGPIRFAATGSMTGPSRCTS